jgi:hypothetical protein
LTISQKAKNKIVNLIGELVDFSTNENTGYTQYVLLIDGERVLVEGHLIPVYPPVIGRKYSVYAIEKLTAYSKSLEMCTYGEAD